MTINMDVIPWNDVYVVSTSGYIQRCDTLSYIVYKHHAEPQRMIDCGDCGEEPEGRPFDADCMFEKYEQAKAYSERMQKEEAERMKDPTNPNHLLHAMYDVETMRGMCGVSELAKGRVK